MPLRTPLAAAIVAAGALVSLPEIRTTHAAQPMGKAAEPTVVLFKNVRVFDGKSDKLTPPTSVLIRGNTIEKIGPNLAAPEKATVIEGGDRTLMPGLIDAHAHIAFSMMDLPTIAAAEPSYPFIVHAAAAKEVLMQGFTAVRDVGGPSFGIKRAIDEGVVPGPRIWPSGPMISQTSGHSDNRTLGDLPSITNKTPHALVRNGYCCVADGADAVRVAVREQLMRGASQIKLAAGGGASSNFDPLDVTQYTKAELEAAVADAENWGTYVTVHVYTPRAIRQAVDAGVRCIEHGHLIDEATMKLLAAKGIWLSLQPFLDDVDAPPMKPGSINRKKLEAVMEGTDIAYRLARKHDVKVAFGTDIVFSPKAVARWSYHLPKLAKWFTPVEVLKMATHDNAKLLALSGKRSPYPGKLGVVEEGALADLLLVDGDPLANIKLLENPHKNFVVIMKDGKIHKNTVR